MSLVDGLRIANENLSREVERLRRQRDALQSSRDYWQRAWTRVVLDVGDLLHVVSERRKGRRFATTLDLRRLLQAQDDEGPDE